MIPEPQQTYLLELLAALGPRSEKFHHRRRPSN